MCRDDDLKERDWPSVAKVYEYRHLARQRVEELLMRIKMEDNSTINWNHPAWVIVMGIEHEKIHLETSMVLIR